MRHQYSDGNRNALGKFEEAYARFMARPAPKALKNGVIKPFYITKLQEWFKEKEAEGQL